MKNIIFEFVAYVHCPPSMHSKKSCDGMCTFYLTKLLMMHNAQDTSMPAHYVEHNYQREHCVYT